MNSSRYICDHLAYIDGLRLHSVTHAYDFYDIHITTQKTDSDLTFDLETAIQVCRQAGYHEHAVYLAEKFEEHDL
jgi:hypothetical protein